MSGRRVVLSVVGTRPNFMKMAPVAAELGRRSAAFEHVLVHTGQHYDRVMSEIFFSQLGLGAPDHLLGVGSGSHAEQTARTIERLEPVLRDVAPDVVLVYGDVNSTLAAAMTAAKLGLLTGHVEAGLRSFDRTMPEEVNRVLTDQLADLLFVHSPEAVEHLRREGRDPADVHYVGNTMIDTLLAMRPLLDMEVCRAHGVEPGGYVLVTLHRPALVDGPLLGETVRRLEALGDELPVVFPVHPRTRANMECARLRPADHRVRLVDPLGYLEFTSLVAGAGAVLTDSGGVQEETTALGVPCLTLRANTERPVTVEEGTNVLLGLDPARIADVPGLAADVRSRPRRVPRHWDGRAAERLADVLADDLHPGRFAP